MLLFLQKKPTTMKTILVITLAVLTFHLKAQEPRYQAYSTSLTIIGTKNGKDLQWENKNINIALDYKTGEFIASLKGSDFSDKKAGQPAVDDAEASPDRIFDLSGTFPVNALINQQATTANYDVELQLTNEDDSLFETILFKMTVTRPQEGQAQYRIFILTGTLFADQLQLPAFNGLDNEISLQLFFNAYWEN